MSANIYSYAVIAIVSNSYPRYQAVTYVTRRSQLIRKVAPLLQRFCAIGHAASVRPGQDQTLIRLVLTHFCHLKLLFSLTDTQHVVAPTLVVLFVFKILSLFLGDNYK